MAERSLSEYRYKRFTTRLLFRDLRFRKGAAAPGDAFPEFELITTDGSTLVNTDIFGDRVAFVMLYVREAHPGENFVQSETIEDKLESARALQEFYGIEWTVAADNVDGDLHRALDPKPNAAFLTNSRGEILFRSLWTADYGALRQALDDAVAGRAMISTQSNKLIGHVASLYKPLSPDQRGVAAVLTLALGMLLMLGLLGALIFN